MVYLRTYIHAHVCIYMESSNGGAACARAWDGYIESSERTLNYLSAEHTS